MGVEEEFHLVDLKTRRLTARAPELLAKLSHDYVAELQSCVVEINSGVVDNLDALRADLLGHRRVLVEAVSACQNVPDACSKPGDWPECRQPRVPCGHDYPERKEYPWPPT